MPQPLKFHQKFQTFAIIFDAVNTPSYPITRRRFVREAAEGVALVGITPLPQPIRLWDEGPSYP